MKKWMQTFTNPYTPYYKNADWQLLASDVLVTGEGRPYPMCMRLGGPQNTLKTEEEKNFLSLLGTEPKFHGC
jgi:hypothetical protein